MIAFAKPNLSKKHILVVLFLYFLLIKCIDIKLFAELTMCLSKYSNLELLREVAVNLYSSKDVENMDGLSERELAALINTFYQVRHL